MSSPLWQLLPLLSLLFVGWGFAERYGFRMAGLLGATIIACLAMVGAEGLSLFRWLRPGPLHGFWILVCAGALIWSWRNRSVKIQAPTAELSSQNWTWSEPAVRIFALLCTLPLGLALFYAGAIPPNNWDSLSYHLPRSANWIDQGSLAHFHVRDTRQLEFAPGASIIFAHVLGLGQTDQFLGLVQWLALLGCGLASSLIVRGWGGSPLAQILAGLWIWTLPMGVLQASTTQNDVLTAFWCLTSVLGAQEFIRSRGESLIHGWLCGAGVALAVHTKSTALLFLAPFALGTLVWGAFQAPFAARRVLARIAVLFVIIQAGHWTRNIEVFGHPLKSPYRRETTEYKTPEQALAGMIRHASVHAGFFDTTAEQELSKWLVDHMDLMVIHPHDPAGISVFLPTKFHIISWLPDHDKAGNPIHLLLLIPIWIWALVRGNSGPRLHASALFFTGFLIAWSLRWSPWTSRIHTGFFALAAPLAGLWLSRLLEWRGTKTVRWTATLLPTTMVVFAFVTLLYQTTGGLWAQDSLLDLSRRDLEVVRRPNWKEPLNHLENWAEKNQPQQVGLTLGHDHWEYAVRRALRRKAAPEIQRVFVGNLSRWIPLSDRNMAPRFLIVIGDPRNEMLLPDTPVRVIQEHIPVSVVELQEPVEAIALAGYWKGWPQSPTQADARNIPSDWEPCTETPLDP